MTSCPHIIHTYPWGCRGRGRVTPNQLIGWRSRRPPHRGRMLLLIPLATITWHPLPLGSWGGRVGKVTMSWASGGHHGLQQWWATQGWGGGACVLSTEISMTSTEGEGLFQILVGVWGLSGPILCCLGALGHCGPTRGVHSLGATRTNTGRAIRGLWLKS